MRSIRRRLRTSIEPKLVRHRRTRPVSGASEFARWFVNASDGIGQWDFTTNGEQWLVSTLAGTGLGVVFDVGANVGDWTAVVANSSRRATIHAFEPVPATFAALAARLGEFGNRVVVVNEGLSDDDGDAVIHFDASKSTVASLYAIGDDNQTESITCTFTTGDHYCATRGIRSIDLLKIDAEGADHLVLRGFSDMLAKQAVRCLQFEYGGWAIESRFLLADFYTSLARCDYMVGRLYPDGVDFRDYATRFENFRLANFVAVRRQDEALITLLSGRISSPGMAADER